MESLPGERLVPNGLIAEFWRVEVTGDGRGVNNGGLYRRMAVDLNSREEKVDIVCLRRQLPGIQSLEELSDETNVEVEEKRSDSKEEFGNVDDEKVCGDHRTER